MKHDPERVLARIDRSGGRDACHPCSGWKKDGYGTYCRDGRERRITHLVLLLDGRPVEPGQQALHHCDNPPCCNPRHLYRGSRPDNVRDMVRRRRQRGAHSGERHHFSKLSDKQAESIRQRFANGALQRELAEEFNVSQPLISAIVNGVRRA